MKTTRSNANSPSLSTRGEGGFLPAWFMFILLGFASILLQLFPPALRWLQFDRPAIAAGQVWRLFTGHWVHWSGEHLFWSGGVFLLLVFLNRHTSPARLITCVLSSVVVISATTWIGTELRFYHGLSGIDSALFMLLAVDLIAENIAGRRPIRAWAALALVIGFIAKIAYEAVAGRAFFVDGAAAGMVPVPLAHLAGAAVGLMNGMMWRKKGIDRLPVARVGRFKSRFPVRSNDFTTPSANTQSAPDGS